MAIASQCHDQHNPSGPVPLGQFGHPAAEIPVYRVVFQEIERTYARFIFRAPTPAEFAAHLRSFNQKCETLELGREAIRRGMIRQLLDIRPLTLEIDVTTQCNLRCIMCAFSDPHVSSRKREDISLENFSMIAAQVFPMCRYVVLQSGTEPLLHKDFCALLTMTKTHGVPTIGMTTNGLLFDEKKIEHVVAMMTNVTISIDAATKATYERIRRKGNFERLLRNIRNLVAAKAGRGSATPEIGLAFVMMQSNIRELPELVQLAHDLGVQTVTATHLTPYQGLKMESQTMDRDRELCNRMLGAARAMAEKYGIHTFFPANFHPPETRGPLVQLGLSALHKLTRVSSREKLQPLDQSISNKNIRRDKTAHDVTTWGDEDRCHCLFPWHYVVIDPYGEVFPCGWWFEQSMGNIYVQSFESIWNSERWAELRAQHESGKLGLNCQNCSATGMGNVNSDGAFVVRHTI
jgi:radical SAM protein with 4Fe4S-binding SPASM domain